MKIVLLGCLLLLLSSVFAIDYNKPYVQAQLMDSNTMGILLVQEWAFGSIDLAFILLSLVILFVFVKYAVPISMVLLSVMGLATVFAFGFNSIIAFGILIAGIVVISLMVVLNLLLKANY
jgi:hypothetical protein